MSTTVFLLLFFYIVVNSLPYDRRCTDVSLIAMKNSGTFIQLLYHYNFFSAVTSQFCFLTSFTMNEKIQHALSDP